MSPSELASRSSLLASLEIMVWNYYNTSGVEATLAKFASANFRGIWVASAFKGAADPQKQVADFDARLANHVTWVQSLRKFGRGRVRGIALTGWQRWGFIYLFIYSLII